MDLKTYLKQVNTTHLEFSQMVGINPKYLSQIVCGSHKPGYRLARDIANLTGGCVSAEDLMRPYEIRKSNTETEQMQAA